jgi:uncharacterized membrane protein HdeD (DUF308 family)
MIKEVPTIAKNWWLFVVLGVICLGTGIAAIVWPDITLLTLGLLAGIYLMIAAFMEILDAIIGEPGGRAMSAILGVIALIAGLICIRRPGETLLALVIALGIYLVAAGVLRIVRAFGSEGNRWWGVMMGGIDLVGGAVVLAWPKLGLVTLAVLFAITMLFRGAFAIVIGLKLRSFRDEDAEAPAQQSASFA